MLDFFWWVFGCGGDPPKTHQKSSTGRMKKIVENRGQHGSNLTPKRTQNQLKIDPKIDQSFDASWNQILEGLWWIRDPQNGAKLMSEWDQKSMLTSSGDF